VELEKTTQLIPKLAVCTLYRANSIHLLSLQHVFLSKIYLKITFSVTCLLLVVLRLVLEQLEIKIWFSDLSHVLVNWFEL